MKKVISSTFKFFLCLLMSLFFNFTSIEAQSLDFSNKKTDVKISQKSMDDKSIDDLLGPDNNFPFDPANHRDGSNPIKRIGKISDDNL